MKKILLIVNLFFVCISLYAQPTAKKDSLIQLLKRAKEDTNKAKLLYDIGEQYAESDAATATQYYHNAFLLCKRINYADGIMEYYAKTSDIQRIEGHLDSTLSLAKEALQFANSQKDSSNIAKALMNVGIAYTALEDLENAVNYLETGRSIFARTSNADLEGKIDDILQLLAHERHQFRKGITYGLQAIEKLSNVKDSENLCYAFGNLSLNYIELKQYDSASIFLDKAFGLAIALNIIRVQILYHLNKGYIHLLEGNFKEMKPFVDKALELSNQYKIPESESLALFGLSNYYLSEKKYPEAKRFADSSLTIANRFKFINVKLRVLPTLSNIAYAMQENKTGYDYLNQYLDLQNNVLSESVTKNTIAIEKKYETEKKETQIKLQQAQLKQKSTLNYFLIGSSAALLLILLLGYRNYRSRQKLQQAKIDELETEKQLTATEAVLKGEEQERTRLAKDLHDGLGGMLSGIKFSLSNMKENLIMTPDNAQAFERSIDMLDSSIKEMRRVAHNMMPEILVKYGLDIAMKEFCNEIDRSGVIHTNYQSIGMDRMEIEPTTAVTIYRIVQELVNNAIKHAAAKNVLVQIHVSVPEKLLMLTVEDDGQGFDKNLLAGSKGMGMGWSNIQNRVEFLKGKADINSAPGKGTSVLIEINI